MHASSARSAAFAFILALGSVCALGVGVAQDRPPGEEWRHYSGDSAGTKYSPLSQIDKDNVRNLRVAWRWQGADRALQLSDPLLRAFRHQQTPLMVNGVLYTVTGLGFVAALDPATGATRWVYDPQSYKAGVPANNGFLQRGFGYWTDGTNERLFVGTSDAYLLSVDARTGKPDLRFGERGKVDLTVGIRDAVRAANFVARRPLVAGNVVVGTTTVIDLPISRKEQPPGDVHGFDVRTGKRLWTFHVIPTPGEVGYDTWQDNSAEYTGAANVWAGGIYDPELDYIYLPTSSATNNYYGGYRLGNNLFAESLVCLEAKTGKRVWHFQAVHHGIWDYDLPAHPILGDITVNGQRIKAVIQISKQGFTYVFDRKTGQPVWPIEERAVPASTVPGERTSPTQPFPTKPPPFELQGSTEDNLIDFTPELRARAQEKLRALEHGPLFTPPSIARTNILAPGITGGANWGGAGFDPDTGILYVPSRTSPTLITLMPVDPKDGNIRYVRTAPGAGVGDGMDTIDGLPIFKPPYSRLTAIDLNRGEHQWIAPLGPGPRDHPLLKDLNLPPLGDRTGILGVLVTKTLVFVSAMPVASAAETAKVLYVFDKQTGAPLHTVELNVFSAAPPMTYMYGGKQYIVFAAGSGPGSELIALALP